MTLDEFILRLSAQRDAQVSVAFLNSGPEAAEQVGNDIDETIRSLIEARDKAAALDLANAQEQVWAQRWKADKGATAADCIQFLNHLRSKLGSDFGMAASIERKLFERCIKLLDELNERRAAMEERVNAQQRANRHKWQEQAQGAAFEEMQEKARQQQKYGFNFRPGSTFYESPFGGGRGSEEARHTFEEMLRKVREEMRKQGMDWDDVNDFTQHQPPPPPPGRKRWFEILGVPINANKQTIKAAARKLRAKYHPDRYKGADAHDRMAEINVAHDEGLSGAS